MLQKHLNCISDISQVNELCVHETVKCVSNKKNRDLITSVFLLTVSRSSSLQGFESNGKDTEYRDGTSAFESGWRQTRLSSKNFQGIVQ